MRDENPLVGDCVQVLRQGLALLEGLDERLYAGTGGLPVHSGVGGHFRHCLDFYHSFLHGVETGCVDYNKRERDARVERDRHYAAARMRFAAEALQSMRVTDGEAPLFVALEGAPPEAASWGRSSVRRELQFLLSHTIHHYALVALMLRLMNFEPGPEFGVNPSTLKHWGQAPPAHGQTVAAAGR